MNMEFVKMISDVQFERFNVHLAELSRNKTACGIFFGFDFNPQAVTANIQALRNIPLNVTCAVVLVDAQANILRNVTDVPVVTLGEFPKLGAELKPQTIFILSGLKDCAFATYFANHGVEVLTSSDDGKFIFVMRHLPELYSVYEMLGSEESKKVYCAAIKGNITGKISDYRFAPEPQYFLNGFMPCEDDIAIDGGAYDGATALDFAKCGAKVHAFEMNADNYKNCKALLNDSGGGVLYHC